MYYGWRRYFVKALLSIFLGLMLLTSFLGISYATPNVNLQPAGSNYNSCSLQPPNTSNMNQTQNCHYRDAGGNGSRHDPPHCVDGQKASEVTGIQPDARCGNLP